MKWDEVLKTPGFDELTNSDQAGIRAHWVDNYYIPELQEMGLPEEDVEGARYQALETFDNGQGYITSFLNSGAQGALKTGTSAIQGAGVLLGSEGIEDFGTGLQQDVEDEFPVNPSMENTNFVGNVAGNVGAFIGTGSAGGLAGKALGSAAIGAEVGSLGTALLGGAGSGAQEADQYGIEGTDRYLKALASGVTEVVSEKIPFLGGMGSELKAISKIPGLSSISPKAAGGFVKAVGSETVEEVFANTAGNLVTTGLAPDGVETPGALSGTLQAAAGGALGGLGFGALGLIGQGGNNAANKASAAAIAAGDPEAAAVIETANATRTPSSPTVNVEAPVITPTPAGDASGFDDVPLVAPQDLDLAEFAAANPITSSSDAGFDFAGDETLPDGETAATFGEDLTTSTQAPSDFAETPPVEVAPLPVGQAAPPIQAELASPPLPPAPTQAAIQQKNEDIRLIDANGRVDEKVATGMFQALKDLGVTTANVVVNETGAPDGVPGIKAKGSFSNNTVFLNRNEVTADTPLHEVTHGLIPEMRRVNPDLFAQGAAILKGSPLESAIRRRYEGRVNLNEEDLMEEVMVTAVANNGAEWLKAYAGNSAAIQQIKQWLAQARVWLEDFMQSKGVDPNMTVEQFAKSVNRRILAGKLKPGAQDTQQPTISPAAQLARRPEARTNFPVPIVSPKDPGFGEDVTRFNRDVADWVKAQPEKSKLVFADPANPEETAFISKEPGQPGKWRATQFKQTDEGQRPAGHKTFKDRETAVKSVTSKGYVPSDARFSLDPIQPVNPEGAEHTTIGGRDVIGPMKFSFPAWHGTPGKIVGKMSTANMGEGEGSQAEGWGLYVADRRVTAGFYQEMNEDISTAVIDDRGAGWTGSPRQLAGSAVRAYGSVEKAILGEEQDLKQARANAEWFGETYKHLDNHWLESVKSHEGTLGKLRSGDYATLTDVKQPPAPKGNIYRVEVDLGKEDLLYWDGPQNPAVEQKLPADMRGMYGSEMYGRLTQKEGSSPEKASKKLLAWGVPGIKYLDGGSRYLPEGEEFSHNYVIFDGDVIRVLEENDREYGTARVQELNDRDREYVSAIKSGDKAKQQMMVDAEAPRGGYDMTGFRSSDRREMSSFPGRVTFVASTRKEANGYGGRAKKVHFWLGYNPTQDEAVMSKFFSDHPSFRAEGTSGFATGLLPSWHADQRLPMWLKEKGIQYDSLFFVEPGGSVSVGLRHLSQLKTADRVTRDDKGRVIPLSERFDFTSDKVFYSLAAEESDTDRFAAMLARLDAKKLSDSNGELFFADPANPEETAFISKEPGQPGKWRATQFKQTDEGQRPAGHKTFKDRETAVKSVTSKGYVPSDVRFSLPGGGGIEDLAPDGVLYRAGTDTPSNTSGAVFYSGNREYTNNFLSDDRALKTAELPDNVLDVRSETGLKVISVWAKKQAAKLARTKNLKAASSAQSAAKWLAKGDTTQNVSVAMANITLAMGYEQGLPMTPGLAEKKMLQDTGYDAVTVWESVSAHTGIPSDFSVAFKDAPPEANTRFSLAAMDDAYMAAVESGDEVKQQEMVDRAAKAAGYSVGPVHHGKAADVGFTVFDPEKSNLKTIDNAGFNWFSESAEIAETYSQGPSSIRSVNVDALLRELRATEMVQVPAMDYIVGLEDDGTVFARQTFSKSKWEPIGDINSPNIENLVKGWFLKNRYKPFSKRDLVGRFFLKMVNPKISDFGGKKKTAPWGEGARQAINEGYDGVVIHNVIDPMPPMFGRSVDIPTTVVGVPSPEQIKSADPVTYDDRGNVIPLSQRFDLANNDIRFSLTPIEYDSKDGLGSVPHNQEVDYRGFVKPMTPDQFLKIAAPGNLTNSSGGIESAIRSGKKVGPPFLNVDWDDEAKIWKVGGHEGRNRAIAIRNIDPSHVMEVHIFPSGWMRARHMTPELKQAPFVPEKGGEPLSIPEQSVTRYSLATEESDTDRFAAMLARLDAKKLSDSNGELYTVDGVQKGFDAEDNYVPMFQQITILDPTHPNRGSTLNIPIEGRTLPLSKEVMEAAIEANRGKFSLAPQYPETDEDGFYSQMQRSLVDKLPERTTSAQVRDIVNNPQYVKPEELKWSGIIPFLEGKDRVTKAEVLEFLRGEGAVRFTETATGEPQEISLSHAIELANAGEVIHAVERKNKEMVVSVQLDNGEVRPYVIKNPGGFIFRRGSFEDAQKRRIGTKYSQYQTPGGTNYREVVVAMPPKADVPQYVIAYRGGPEMGGSKSDTLEQAQAELESMFPGRSDLEVRLSSDTKTPSEYTSPHFPTPNYLAHTRLNDRTDASGKEGTLIEELQSDRHQKGRTDGYKEDNGTRLEAHEKANSLLSYVVDRRTVLRAENQLGTLRDVRDGSQDLKDRYKNVLESDPEMVRLQKEYDEARAYADSLPPAGNTPDAPYRKDWPLMLFKRVLRDAVASGKQWVGWTTGATQNDRFDLSKQVDTLKWDNIDGNGNTIQIQVKTPGSSQFRDMGTHTADKLSDVVGKDMASKILDAAKNGREFDEYSGIDLRVGGSGMTGFYDNILPKEIGKYVKQWKDENGVPAKVEKGNLDSIKDNRFTGPGGDITNVISADGNVLTTYDQTNPETRTRLAQRWIESNQSTYPGARLEEGSDVKQLQDNNIWKVEITPKMAEEVAKGQPRYSLAAGNTMRPSGLAANQPGTPVREMTAGMVYQGESMQPAYDQAVSEFNKVQREGGDYDRHKSKFNDILANPTGEFFNLTPGAYWGLMLKQLSDITRDPNSDPGMVEEAERQKRELAQFGVDMAAREGQFIKGFDGGLRIANDPVLQVETADSLVPFDGSVTKRQEFDKEKAAVTREVDKFTREVLADTDEAQLTRDIEKGLGDVARGDDASDAGEVEVEDVRAPDVAAMEAAGVAAEGWLKQGITKFNGKVAALTTKWLYNTHLLNALNNLTGKFALPEEGDVPPEVAKVIAGITTKAERDAAIRKARAEIEALTKQLTSIRSAKVSDDPVTSEDRIEEMAVGRLKAALERLANPKAKKAMKATEEKIASAITSGILSKAGLGGRLPPGADNMVFATGLLLANRSSAASVLQNIHDIIKGDPDSFADISRDKLRAFMEVAIGRSFDTAEGATDKAPPYSEKQIASLLRAEIKRTGTSMTKIVKDAALSRTAPAALEAQLRDPKRPYANLLSPADLDKVVGAVMMEYNRTAAERVANYKAQEARLEKLAAERGAAALEGREMRKEVNAARREAIDRKMASIRARRKARKDNRSELIKARKAGEQTPAPEPLGYNEKQDLLKVEPKRVIDYLAREFGFDISGIVKMARSEDRTASLNAMVVDLARTLGLSTEQTRKFMQPVIAKAMEKVDASRKKKVEKIIADKVQRQSGRMQKKGAQPTEAQRLLRLAELGGLDAENIEAVMLNSMGGKKFSEDFKRRLEKVLAEANDPNLPQATRDQRTAAFLGMVKSARGVYATSLWGEYMMSNIFLNVLSTLKVNAVWGFVKASADSAVYLARFDPLNLVPEAKLPKGARKALVRSMMRGFSRDMQYQAAYIFKTGRSKLESDYTTQFSNSDFETLAHFPETEIRLWQDGKQMSPFWASKVKLLAKFSKYTRRAMVGTDIANRTPGYEMMKANAIVKLIHERSDNPPTTSDGWAKAIDDAMYGGSFEQAKVDAKKEVARLLAAGQLDQSEAGVQFGVEMDKLLGKSLGLSEVERVELLSQATESAKRLTVANATEGLLGGISNSLLTAVREVPGLKFLLPAIRMPIGAFSQGLDWTPLGFLRAQAIGWNQGKSASVTNYLFNRDGAKKTWNLPAGAISNELAVELRTKAMFGTSMAVAIYIMAAAAMDDDEDEADFYITGRGPEDPGRNKIWREKGNQPFMIRMKGIGSIRFQESPAFPVLAGLGAWSDAQRYSKPGTAQSDKIFFAITRGLSAFGDAAVLKNLQDVIATSTGGSNTGSGMQKAGQVVSRLAGIAIAPRIGQEVNQILYGTQDQKAGGWGARIFANVPFTPSLFGKPALNFFGEEIHQQRGGPSGELFPMLSHRLTSPLTDDEQMRFMARFGANQTVTSRRFKDGTRVMDEYDFVRTWQTESGKRLREWLTPEKMERYEKMRAKDVMTAEKEFDKEILDIRTDILRKIGKGRVDF